jgi:ABC-2 type transport system permease protein
MIASARRTLRLVFVVWRLHLKMMSVSAFDGFMQIVWPLMFATSALLMVKVNNDPDTVTFTVIGVAMMGIWSAMATTASSMLQEERWAGTLELLVAAPTRFSLVLVPISMSMATLGLISVAATLLWARLVFGIWVPIQQPIEFVVAILVSVGSMSTLGFLLSVTVVRYRTAWALGNVMEFPGWLVCGFVVPLALLPEWTRPISAVLAPTWGVGAARDAVGGSSPWPEIALCGLLGIAYWAIGALISRSVLDSARRRSTLSLT